MATKLQVAGLTSSHAQSNNSRSYEQPRKRCAMPIRADLRDERAVAMVYFPTARTWPARAEYGYLLWLELEASPRLFGFWSVFMVHVTSTCTGAMWCLPESGL